MATQMTTIRFPSDVYQRLKKYAEDKHLSVNQVVVESVSQMLSESSVSKMTIESRLILNEVIPPKKIFAESGLVLVNGIYYRFLTNDNQPIIPDTSYVVVEAVGNILTIQSIRK